MKSIVKIFLLMLWPVLIRAQDQQGNADSLHAALHNAANDTIRMDINRKLGFFHQDSNADTALVYHDAQRVLAQKLDLKLWEADAYQQIAYCCSSRFRLSEAYENYIRALRIAEDPATAAKGWGYSGFSYSGSPEEARQSIIGMIHFELSAFYNRTRNNEKRFSHLKKALEIGERLNNLKILSIANRDISTYYGDLNMQDSAYVYIKKSLNYYQHSPYQRNLGVAYLALGTLYERKREYDSAKFYMRKAIHEHAWGVTLTGMGTAQRALGQVYLETGQLDSALIYTMRGKQLADSLGDIPGRATAFNQLATIYELKKEFAVAYDYLKTSKRIGDNLNDGYINRLMQFLNLDFDQKIRLQELEKEREQAKGRNRMLAMLAGLGIFLLVALLLYRNNRQKQKANKVLENTLANLRSTQSQLIQSEKMASLGELTAGIAHEIQNPLNFVNNFSEVNKELTVELEEELDKGNYTDARSIAKDIRDNEIKINHHGNRADAIVKGMLQHSRSGSGEKEPTDINALCDEYLRFAYHGLKARDKNFEASFHFEPDPTLPKINVVPQDIGRALLNLINNAFQACTERSLGAVNGFGEKPMVTVTTLKRDDIVEIKVADNGPGIPDAIRDKIFQPFFTTKATGQGTGLGLSLSYDIIKAHGGSISVISNYREPGELRVETQEGEFTKFIIQIPG